jgi:hypothetical protein
MTTPYISNENIFDNALYEWDGLTIASPDGQPSGFTASGDRTVQVQGTFGAGGTVVIEGTLNNVDWYTLRDPSGVLLSFTSANIRAVLENTIAIRPRVTGGDGSTSITVILSIRKQRNG